MTTQTVDANQEFSELFITPGDQVLVMMVEAPSTGYWWRPPHLPPGIRLIQDSTQDQWNPGIIPMSTPNLEAVGGTYLRVMLFVVDEEHGLDSLPTTLVLEKKSVSWSEEMIERKQIRLNPHIAAIT